MANKTISYGSVSVTIAENLMPPEAAGTLSPTEMARVPKAPRNVGAMCEDAADAIERAGKLFVPPAGVTADKLRQAGERADGTDVIIHDMEVLLHRLKQGNVLHDADAYSLVRQVNDQVKAQAKLNPELNKIFALLLQGFATGRKSRPEPEPEPTPAPAPKP